MSFEKKLKIRLGFSIGCIVSGIALIVLFCVTSLKNEFLSYYGIALVAIGFANVRRYFLVTKSDESFKRQEIAENDERNISIVLKARNFAFTLYIIAASITSVTLYLLEKQLVANILSYSICAIVLFYWVGYFVIRRKS